jgi:putative holliday junction resolvase
VPALSSILGMDVGEKRVGLAVTSLEAKLPQPLRTIDRSTVFDELPAIIEEENIMHLVIGLPRNLSGRSTAQTKATESFVDELRQHITLPITLQDEAVTSKQAEAELKARGKTYRREEIDALAAVYLLEDYLATQTEMT